MLLTEQERILVLNFRETQQKLLDADTPIKYGYLKQDLYSYIAPAKICEYNVHTVRDRDNAVERLHNAFIIALRKGTEFVCYRDGNSESWFDNINYGIEGENAVWASKFLDITDKRKKKNIKKKNNEK